MSPEVERFMTALRPFQTRLGALAAVDGLLVAAAAAGVTATIAALSGWEWSIRAAATGATLVIVFGAAAWRLWRRIATSRVAARVEAADRDAHNLVVTAEEIASGRAAPPHRVIHTALFEAATARLEALSPAAAVPITARAAWAAAAVFAVSFYALLVPVPAVATRAADTSVVSAAAPLGPGDLRVVVTSPAYSRIPVSESVNPAAIDVLEGSQVRLEVTAANGQTDLVAADGSTIPFHVESDRVRLELVARTSQPLLIRQQGSDARSRLVQLRVRTDQLPVVRIERPAKDLVFPNATGDVPLHVNARDDVGLASLVLRYTKISGSGENFTFEEGEWPIAIARTAEREWTGQATLALARLGLQDGDTLVYRALARDARPGADPASSDTFLIEIGQLSGVAATGFALPDDRERMGLSQQMLIVKTEKLHAARPTMAADAFTEQSRLLAVEQRMVKAEFVFMTGGEVEDEVEEATHAHELAEGRLENAAQVELLNAIREMSRAEERLNGSDTTRALEFERAALKALQRAFDRRRYLLRTLPERTRIDAGRRLTGELAAARSSHAATPAVAVDPAIDRVRALVQELGRAKGDATDVTLLASRLLAIDAADGTLQTAALGLSSAADADGRSRAIGQAQLALVELLKRRLAPAAPAAIRRDALQGAIGDAMRRGGVR